MANVAVDITVSSVQYTTWLRTSYIASAVISDGGRPMIEQLEMGNDQEDALQNFLDEAAREVLKVFMSRQGDLQGDVAPFEYNGTNAIYRFFEEEPPLPQSASIKSSLNEDVKNALYTYVAYMWFKFKGKEDHAKFMIDRYEKLTRNIDRHLYKLHD